MKGSKARTERGKFTFTVKEFADGTPFVTAEGPDHRTMPALEDAFISFTLPDRTSFEQAHTVADFMNEHIAGMSMTIFDTHPLYNHAKKTA